MSKTMKAWLTTTTSLALLLLGSACGTLGLGKSTYELRVRGNPTEEVLSMFLVVAETGELGDTTREQGIKKIIDTNKVSQYKVFGQYEPLTDGSTPWREVSVRNDLADWVEIELDDEEPLLIVEIEQDSLETYSSLAVVVIVSTRESWFAEKIGAAEMMTSEGAELEIRSSEFLRRSIE